MAPARRCCDPFEQSGLGILRMNTSTTQPAVSIVMAVYNRADYLPQALASLRWQTLTNWECICVDDGSTDATPDVLAAFAAADNRFRILRQENAGVVAALDRGDRAARADWIARMDSDDVALPERLERQRAYVEEHPDVVGLGGNVLMVDPEGASIGLGNYALSHAEIEQHLLAGRGETIAHPTLFYRRDLLERIGGHRIEFGPAHDADFLIRLAQHGKLANLEETLLLYRQHPGNLCRVKQAEMTQLLRQVRREAHEARGLPVPAADKDAKPTRARSSTLVGKWARLAARHGNVATAWRLLKQQITSDPFSPYTARITAEVILRGAIAAASGKRGHRIELPDWRAWDCPVGADSGDRAAA